MALITFENLYPCLYIYMKFVNSGGQCVVQREAIEFLRMFREYSARHITSLHQCQGYS